MMQEILDKLEREYAQCEYCFLPADDIFQMVLELCTSVPFLDQDVLNKDKSFVQCLDYIQIQAEHCMLEAHVKLDIPDGFFLCECEQWSDDDIKAWILEYYALKSDEISASLYNLEKQIKRKLSSIESTKAS